jgi:hypothetical protein
MTELKHFSFRWTVDMLTSQTILYII